MHRLRDPTEAVSGTLQRPGFAVPLDPRKHVCMLCPGGIEHSGGIGRWAGYMLTAWRDAGLQPVLEVVDTRGFGGYAVGALAFVRAMARLIGLRACGRLGLIHANLAVRGSAVRKFLVAMMASLTGTRLVVHLHAGNFFEFYDALPRLGRFALRWVFASASHVIVLGHVWEDQVVSVLGVPRAKITILYNAVRRPARLARATPPDGVYHIVMLGRLIASKGLPELLSALSGAPMRKRAWRATLAGDGAVRATAEEATRLGIGDRVVCTGWLDAAAVADLLREADILVLPSYSENLPVAVIEALAHRIPVVTTPVGATPELVEDGVSALFVPVGDAAALALALCRLIDDPSLRARIAAHGHEVFLTRLDADIAAPMLAALYDDVMRGK